MTLIKCKECGGEVSDEAKICPKCGARVPKAVGLLGWIFVIFVAVVVYQCTTRSNNPGSTTSSTSTTSKPDWAATAAVTLAKRIKDSAKNPESIEWSSVIYIQQGASEGEGIYCIEFRGRNSFNAKVIEHVAFKMTDAASVTVDWNKNCGGKEGTSYLGIVKLTN